MDRYKKKNLKFDSNLGLAGDLRAVERSTLRAESRHTRFSLLRCFKDEESENQPIEKNEEAASRIPTFGKPNLKAPMSRVQMLQKWKEEKQMKRQQELKTKKPTFKAGLAAPKPVSAFPSFANTTNKFQSKTDSRMKTFTDSRMKTSADTRTRLENKSGSKTIKSTSEQPPLSCKSQASSLDNTKILNRKESGIQSSNKSIPVAGNKNLKTKQVSHIQVPMKSNTTLQKPSSISTKQIKSQGTGVQIPLKSQIAPKKTSYISLTKEVPTKEFHNQLPNKSKSTSQKQSFITTRQTKTELSSGRIGKFPEKPSTQIKETGISFKNSSLPKPQSKTTSKIGIPSKKKEDIAKIPSKKKEDTGKIFGCELSHIEPSEDKPVVSKGFIFQPPNDLSFSFLDGGISAVFSKLRAGTARTSTPKRADIKEVEEKSSERSFTGIEKNLEIEVFSHKEEDPPSESHGELSECSPEIKANEKEYIPIDPTSNFDEENKTNLADQDSILTSQKSFDSNKLQTSEKKSIITEDIFENKLEIKTQAPGQNVLEVDLSVIEESPILKDLKSGEFAEQQNIDLQEKEIPAGVIEDSLPVFAENPLSRDSTSPEFLDNIDLHKKRDPLNIQEGEPVFKGKIPFLNQVTTSEFSQQMKSHLLDDEVPKSDRLDDEVPKSDLLDDKVPDLMEFSEVEKSDLKVVLKQEPNLERLEIQDSALSLSKASSSIVERSGPSFKIPSNPIELQKKDSPSEDDVSVINRSKPFTRSSEIKTRSFRSSEMPPLESINESLENSSLLESPAKPSKKEPRKKSVLPKDFTPRRSTRLAKLSELDSTECLFDVRPSFYATPPDSRNGACSSRSLAYDFDNLHLESSSKEEQPVPHRPATRNRGKVSLLYTPPQKGRVSTMRKSIKGDLMSFSPDV